MPQINTKHLGRLYQHLFSLPWVCRCLGYSWPACGRLGWTPGWTWNSGQLRGLFFLTAGPTGLGCPPSQQVAELGSHATPGKHIRSLEHFPDLPLARPRGNEQGTRRHPPGAGTWGQGPVQHRRALSAEAACANQCTHARTWKHVHAHVCTQAHTCKHAHTPARACMHMHTYARTREHTSTCAHACTRKRTHAHTHAPPSPNPTTKGNTLFSSPATGPSTQTNSGKSSPLLLSSYHQHRTHQQVLAGLRPNKPDLHSVIPWLPRGPSLHFHLRFLNSLPPPHLAPGTHTSQEREVRHGRLPPDPPRVLVLEWAVSY